MQVEIEDISPVEKKLTVTIPAERVRDELEEFYAEVGKTVRVKGFRPGKVPRPHLERLFAEEVRNQVGAKLVKETFQTALERKQLKPVTEPAAEPTPLEPDRDFTYTLRVEIMPPVEARDYRGLAVEREVYPVSDPEVDAALRRMQEDQATLRDLHPARGAEPGDVLLAAIATVHEGKPVAGSKGQKIRFVLGGESGMPEFVEPLRGIQPGESRTFPVTYPADDKRSELAGKTVTYTVSVQELKERVLPALDDEFAKDQGDCATVAELREKTRKGLETYAAERSQRRLEQAVIDRLVEQNPIPAPPSLVQRRSEELAKTGLLLMRRRQVDEEVFRSLVESFRGQAEKEVRAAYLLEAVARQENLSAGPGDVDRKIQEMAQAQNVHLDKLKDRLAGADEQERLKNQVAEEKTLAFLIEQAKIKVKAVRADAEKTEGT